MMRVRTFGVWLSILAICFGVLIPARTALAAESAPLTSLNLTTSPLPLQLKTKPGQTIVGDIRIKNNSSKSEALSINLLKFGANGDDGTPKLMDRESRDTYFDWVKFSENSFIAEPNVWKTIKMTIKVPDSAANGYYYSVVFSRTNQFKPDVGASSVQGGIAVLVLLDVNVPGSVRRTEISEFSASQKVYEFLPAEFTVKIKNTGTVHISPFGNIFLKRGEKQIDMLDFNASHGSILPESSRVFKSSWSKGFPTYKITPVGNTTKSSLKWDFSHIQDLRFGRYSAHLVAVYDDGKRDVPIESVVSFWVIPWRIIGVCLLIILFVGAGLWFMLRAIWKKLRPGGRKPKSGANDPSKPPQSTQVSNDPDTSLQSKPAVRTQPTTAPALPTSRLPQRPVRPSTVASRGGYTDIGPNNRRQPPRI